MESITSCWTHRCNLVYPLEIYLSCMLVEVLKYGLHMCRIVLNLAIKMCNSNIFVWFKNVLFLHFKLTCKTYTHTKTIYRIGMEALSLTIDFLSQDFCLTPVCKGFNWTYKIGHVNAKNLSWSSYLKTTQVIGMILYILDWVSSNLHNIINCHTCMCWWFKTSHPTSQANRIIAI